ncbi:HNH endonuclease domain-containing protein [Alteromonas sp. P256]|uniref:HNH endonuclease domain-containing protein n=1 Tax=Alteromonas sp. P256 TaxID=3117399 RepID=UPI002FE29171
MSKFYELNPSNENYWRAIILFGRNVASYKFALAKALYDLRETKSELITLEELAPYFAKHICEHLKSNDKQATSKTSKYLDYCRQYNLGEISKSDLTEATRRFGFNNVIDAFHNVHNKNIDNRFFYDERKTNDGIRLSDNFFHVAESDSFYDLNQETEARWRLVETAWELGVSKNVVQIEYDQQAETLITKSEKMRRIEITSSRNALNGYQKGKCFYCFREISLEKLSENLADVDHFFPHRLKECSDGKPVDGISNLVLACKECNRGANGKFDRIPTLKLLERLHKRNEYLISSHHPLRETLMLQTGLNEKSRIRFLQDAYDCSNLTIVHKWEPQQVNHIGF